MSKINLKGFSIFLVSSFLFLSSCKKINEATQLGADLIPAVDNINTFETSFSTETNNILVEDSTRLFFNSDAALGNISDPEFGTTKADIYFNIAPGVSGTNPFYNKDSVQAIDSVVLSLSYKAAFGDTNSLQSVKVFEIAQTSSFRDTAYRFQGPGFETGQLLGTVSYSPKNLNDTIVLVRKSDTVKTANVLRIPLSNTIGDRFKLFDTTNSSNGGFRNDSIFYTLFRGLALRADVASGNGALSYFNLSDRTKTRLTVYFRVQRNGKIDTASTDFYHIQNGQANLINRTPSGSYLNYLTNGSSADDKLYIQSTPGSAATVKIPSLDTFTNKIIHRAELLTYRVPSTLDNYFTTPPLLFLDQINTIGDTAFVFLKDLLQNENGFDKFGGKIGADGSYRFNITRAVQDVIAKKQPNYTLRLYAPLTASLFVPLRNKPERTVVDINSLPANGRVVLAGGSYTDPALRMRLRIIYSKIQ